jgi:hypothetical protein
MPYPVWSRGDYTRSININLTDEQTKSIESQGPWTDWIEQGHGEIDLKPGLLAGEKARQGKNGPYNIVAFRHGTTQAPTEQNPMPINVYNLIRRETNKADAAYKAGKSNTPGTSRVTGQNVPVQRASGKVDMGRSYQWGYRLPESQGGQKKVKQTTQGQYQWKTGKRTGMVRMAADTSRARSSSYITFRVVSINSDPASWLVPPKDPNPIRQAVIDSLQEEVQGILKLAMEEDLK